MTLINQIIFRKNTETNGMLNPQWEFIAEFDGDDDVVEFLCILPALKTFSFEEVGTMEIRKNTHLDMSLRILYVEVSL